MLLRKKLEDHRKLVGVAAALVGGLALVLIIMNLTRANGLRFDHPKWMYDLNSGELVAAAADAPSPSVTESGPFAYPGLGSGGALVDAVVMSCGEATAIRAGMTMEDLEAVDGKIAYLARGAPGQGGGGSAGAGALLSEPDGRAWVARLSPEGMRINADAFEPCADGCLPVQTRP